MTTLRTILVAALALLVLSFSNAFRPASASPYPWLDGADGANGQNGNLGSDGHDGEDGKADSGPNGPRAGDGGNGGNGGESYGSFVGGDGGDGGDGADLVANSAAFESTTTAGNGGNGGNGGSGPLGTGMGGSGGNGGSIFATSPIVGLNQIILAGNGGSAGVSSGGTGSGGRGGDITLIDVSALTIGSNSGKPAMAATQLVPDIPDVAAVGGWGGDAENAVAGDGGNAKAIIRGDVTYDTLVRGGDGGDLRAYFRSDEVPMRTGNGGNAAVEFLDSAILGGNFTAQGGNAGLNKGSLSASNKGSGGNATVERRAVSESTSLVYLQRATGGDAEFVNGPLEAQGQGGDAFSDLVVSGHDMRVSSVAMGGSSGGNAIARIDAEGTGRIDVGAYAIGGGAFASMLFPNEGTAQATATGRSTSQFEPIVVEAVAGQVDYNYPYTFAKRDNSASAAAHGPHLSVARALAYAGWRPLEPGNSGASSNAFAAGKHAIAEALTSSANGFVPPMFPTHRVARARSEGSGAISLIEVELEGRGGVMPLIASAATELLSTSEIDELLVPPTDVWTLSAHAFPVAPQLAGIPEHFLSAGLGDNEAEWLLRVTSPSPGSFSWSMDSELSAYTSKAAVTASIDPRLLDQNQNLVLVFDGSYPEYLALPASGEVRFSIELNSVSLVDVVLPTGDRDGLLSFFEERSLLLGAVSDFSALNLTLRFASTGEAFVPFSEFILATVPKPGDANGDGRADGADYIAWASNFRRTSRNGSVDGDFNHDGFVDGRDYIEWANAFSSSSAMTTVAVPEPASLISLFAGVALLAGPVLRRSRTRR